MSIVGGGCGLTTLNVKMPVADYIKSRLIDEVDMKNLQQNLGNSPDVNLTVICNQMQSNKVVNYLILRDEEAVGSNFFHVELYPRSVLIIKYAKNDDCAFFDYEEMSKTYCADLLQLGAENYPNVCYLNLRDVVGDLFIPYTHTILKNVSYVAVMRRPVNTMCISAATTVELTYQKSKTLMYKRLNIFMDYLKKNGNEFTGSSFDLMHYLCQLMSYQTERTFTWEITNNQVENLIMWFFEPSMCNLLSKIGLSMNTASKNVQ